jgi:catechol 2,3-dioxygenase-like lactoylglutathione lyase family enzyme
VASSPRHHAFDPADVARGRRRYAPAKLAHLVLKTTRPETMIRWWSLVLDAQVVFENDHLAFLTYDTEHHRLAIVKVPRLLAPIGVLLRNLRKVHGLDHVAFTWDSLDGLLATWRRLTASGVEPVWCINHGPTTSLYYEDPDGNRVELQYDNFATTEELLAFVDSGAFAENPIGVEFDPALLAEKLDAGVPLAQLVQRGSATPPGQMPVAGYGAVRWRTL